jgi:Zn-dependent M28 family amino/carboxypeptidase
VGREFLAWEGLLMKSVRTVTVLAAGGLVMIMALSLAVSAYRVARTGPGMAGGGRVAIGAGGLGVGADKADEAMATIRPEAIRADMRFLSDDLLEGRGTGSRGHEIAAKYMAAQFEQMGLQPWGDAGTYFQNVPFRASRPDAEKTTLTLVRGGKEEKFEFRKDFITRGDPGRTESSVEAEVVFVGDGVTAPEQGYDDYKGVDTKGKIVAMLFEAPNFETSLKAHYSSSEVKLANATAHGAVGVILLNDPVFEKLYSYEEQVRDLAWPQLNWLDPQGRPNDYNAELKGGAFLNLAAAKRFFQGTGHSVDEVYAAMKAGKTQSFATGITAKIHNVTKLEDVHSPNIVAKLEGSDPALKDEYVVYTSHLDHLGIGEPVNGDKIYNGALDNASGSACLLEVARAFRQMNSRPRRSILFVSVTAEEAGLLGSDYFAHYPTVAKSAIVANVNMDEDQMLWPLKDIIAYGAEHSSLEETVKEAAERMHLGVSPDPMPEEVDFIRSDQYSFVKAGIPAVCPAPGFKSDDPKINPAAIFKNWEETRYHQPSDDMNQPGLDFEEAARFARFNWLVGYMVAQKTERPTWKPGDFFGEHYGKK